MNTRRKIPEEIEKEVLIRSKRRCCLCFGLNNDIDIKKGQIAHIDQNREYHSEDNLVFLCFDHHDQFDSRTSQSKNYTGKEIKHYRHLLYAHFQIQAVASIMHAPLALVTEYDIQEALVFYTSPHRSQSAVLTLRQGQRTMNEINEEIPPCDLEWTEIIISSVINYGWARENPVISGNYQITLNGKRMLAVLDLLPEDVKHRAWKEVWQPEYEE